MNDRLTVIDFHSHILPLDHGCADIHMSVKQLELMSSHGTEIAVATPHFYPHIHKVAGFTQKLSSALDALCEKSIDRAPGICVGAEVLLCENLEAMDGLESLCIGGTNVLLLELPLHSLKRGHVDTVEELIRKGFDVVLAHIDRYLLKYSDGIDALLSLGAKAQINADAPASPRLCKRLSRYIENGDVCAIGSDLHGIEERSYKRFCKSQKYLKEHYGEIMSRALKLLSDARIIELKKEM